MGWMAAAAIAPRVNPPRANPRWFGSGVCCLGLHGRLGHLAGLDAACAHVHPLGRVADLHTDALDVGIPPALGPAMRVAEAHAKDGFLIANVADGGHGVLSLILVPCSPEHP